ncbi:MAG: glycosidase [Candidatus Riflebacteria bacterium]|nr:glycosidase [Candidatus Riflebacteria bacterium]
MTESGELFRRHPSNPILTAAHWPYPVNSVFNPAATTVKGRTLLLVRVEDRRGSSHLTVAQSSDGFTGWEIARRPALRPEPDTYPEETFGVEDPRVTWLEDRGEWAVCYTAYGPHGPLVSLALTRDFGSFERIGAITPPENKDAALFPVRIGDRWAMLHRPVPGGGGAHIWIAYSPDLRHWGDHRPVLLARSHGWWDAAKIGLNVPPIPTSEGWLIIYHGVRNTAAGSLYRLGLALLDRDDPTRVLRRTDEWVMGPREPYELEGDVGRVVFPCGWTLVEGELRIYYGAADTSVAVATAPLADLVAHVLRSPGQ